MTENKRFELAYEQGNWWAVKDGDITLWKEEVIHLLNKLYDENQKLKKENEQIKEVYTQLRHRHSLLHDVCLDAECDRDSYRKDVESLEKENEELKFKKERYERLSEIREQEINNRILSLKEFIENCHDDAVKKALTDYFYSTLNEYDLSAKYRELKKENEQLKHDLALYEENNTNEVIK